MMKLTEKQKNCPYCHGKKSLRSEDNDYQQLIIDDDDHVLNYEECLYDGTWPESNFGWKTAPFLINYCPMCGRSLTNGINS